MNVLKNKMQRRDFLRTLGKVGMVLPFASQFMLMNKAHALPGGARRFVQFFYPNGCNIEKWHSYPTGTFSNSSFDNNDCPLIALAPYYENILAIKNLSYIDGQGAGTDHPTPAGTVMSGGRAGTQSIENAIGYHLQGKYANHLYVGVRAGGLQVYRDRNGNGITPVSNPQSVYDSNFADLSGGGSDPTPEQRKRKKILEMMDENLDLLQVNRLSDKESAKLGTYRDTLDFYRRVLDSDISVDGFSRPTVGIGADNSVDAELEAHAQMDIIRMAFASDFTRTAAVHFTEANGDPILQNFPSISQWLGDYRVGGPRGNYNENRSHACSHKSGSGGGEAAICNAQTIWYNMIVAELIKRLKEVEDPVYDGTVFDNTVTMIMTEQANAGNHGNDNASIYVAAGNNTGINTGRGIDASGRGPADLQFELTRAFNMGLSGFGNSHGSSGINGFYR